MADTKLDTSAWGKQYHSYGENGILDGTYEAGTEPDKEASRATLQLCAVLGTFTKVIGNIRFSFQRVPIQLFEMGNLNSTGICTSSSSIQKENKTRFPQEKNIQQENSTTSKIQAD